MQYFLPILDLLANVVRSAVNEQRGIHSGKEQPPPKQPLNISEVRTLLFVCLCFADSVLISPTIALLPS